MLGEQISEGRGKVTSQRVLPGDDYRYVKVEITFEEQGTLFGQQATNFGTYTVYERVPGQLFGTGQGIVGTKDGEGAIWTGHGVGRMTGEGMGMSFRFSLAFQAGAEGKLSKLNGMLLVGEHEVSENNETQTKGWEWQ